MSLTRQYKAARSLISELCEKDKKRLIEICDEIREAEILLQKKSRRIMTRCIQKCEGICCRNVQLDLIINYLDFLFITALEPVLNEKIKECLKKEQPFFSSDCIFLENGEGPCIFPSYVRPEVCLVTFCDNISSIKKEIRKVKLKFFKLTWFVMMRKPRAVKNWIVKKIDY
jgi:hypothetical protein